MNSKSGITTAASGTLIKAWLIKTVLAAASRAQCLIMLQTTRHKPLDVTFDTDSLGPAHHHAE